MGKKLKKKAARTAHKEKEKEKEKRPFAPSPAAVSQEDSAVIADDVKPERTVCIHLHKSVNLGCVSSKIETAVSTGCEDCREGVNDRKTGKGKTKHGKKKGASDKATWICLQCGHFSCGGVGLPTNPQSHALRHAKQSRHPLVIQMENPHLRWCFTCSSLLPVDKSEDTGEPKDVFLDIVKLLKNQSSKVPSVDVEDIWFGSGSVLSEVKVQSKADNVANGKDFYTVKGLVNLGNTCFFNSVMQNLLAMDILREYMLKFEGSVGPFTSALKKVFVETSPESGLRHVINPRSLFGCVCAKAPQFKGYQQQDSHELLRYLLDGLSFEDLNAKKSASSLPSNGGSLQVCATFVDAIFGGQTSSVVCCVECGHSSVVYEPFLDLSLSVPTKKPLSKKSHSVSRAKKTKPPPKRGGKTRPKLNKNENIRPVYSGFTSTSIGSSSGSKGDMGPAPSGCNASTGTELSFGYCSESLSCAPSADIVEASNVAHRDALLTRDFNSIEPDYVSIQLPGSVDQDVDGMSWMDYLGPMSQSDGAQEDDSSASLDYLKPDPLSYDSNSAENDGFSITQDLESHDCNHDTVSIQNTAKSSVEDILSEDSTMKGDSHDGVSVPNSANSVSEVSVQPDYVNLMSGSTVGDWDDKCPMQVQDNEILLLTYKEDDPVGGEGMKDDIEISSSAFVNGEDTLGFDGLGDLFNEPEDVGTSVSNVQASEHLSNGFPVENSTESDPDEVDDTDSPVSVESCLAHFIKPELLSGEHAWHCENCSKLLKEERQRMRKNLQKVASVQSYMSIDVCLNSEVLQATSQPFTNSSALVLAAQDNGGSDIDGNLKRLNASRINGICPNLPQEEEKGCEHETEHLNDSVSAGFRPSDETYLDGNSVDSHGVFNNHVPVEGPSGLSEDGKVEEDDEGEVDLKCVKVMRDATKRILISKAPPILTIHLKRFGQDARGRLSKLNGHVGFKEHIDLGPYMDCRSTEIDNCIYRLVGVVEHSGSMRGGHYIAYVRGRRRKTEEANRPGHSVWYHASDTQVREVTLEEVLGCEAYLLFYEKAKL